MYSPYGVDRCSNQRLAEYKPSVRELGWIAGFIEGEGCFSSGIERIIVVRKQLEPLLILQKCLGGYISKYRNSWGNLMYRWSVTGKRARGIMLTLYLLMSTKRKKQIKGAISPSRGIKLADLLKANL